MPDLGQSGGRSHVGYARRDGVMADVRSIDGSVVTGERHDNGRRVYWRLTDAVELFEFGSFNPANENYMPGGRPVEWGRKPEVIN